MVEFSPYTTKLKGLGVDQFKSLPPKAQQKWTEMPATEPPMVYSSVELVLLIL